MNIPDNFGQLPLHHAAAIGNLPLVHRLVEAFPQALATADINGNYPFHCAVRSNDREVLAFFYTDPRCLERRNSFGMTPLMMAVAVDAQDSFAFLLERGADPAVRTLSGNTLFLTAAAHGRLAMMDRLY